MDRVDEIIVYVYCDGKLIKSEKFSTLSAGHKFIEGQTFRGYRCTMKRLENGRPWATFNFWPKESI